MVWFFVWLFLWFEINVKTSYQIITEPWCLCSDTQEWDKKIVECLKICTYQIYTVTQQVGASLVCDITLFGHTCIFITKISY